MIKVKQFETQINVNGVSIDVVGDYTIHESGEIEVTDLVAVDVDGNDQCLCWLLDYIGNDLSASLHRT